MEDTTNKPTPLSALRHPAFLAALGLLVMNDHVLKGAGLLPGWVTGKLSDFAGLIVAPIALAALLRARSAPLRALAFGVVAAWFTAINLSGAAAAATCDLLGALGVASRLWVDPTDLIALSILPLAWHISAHVPGTDSSGPEGRWPQRVALGLSMAACIATSPIDPPRAEAILHNDTGSELQVEVRWASAAVDCAAVRDRLGEALTDASFGPASRFTVPADRVISLDRRSPGATSLDTFTGSSSGPSRPANRGTCEVARIAVDGLPTTIALWQGLAPTPYPSSVGSDEERADAARGLVLGAVDGDDEALSLSAARGFALAEAVAEYDGDAFCAEHGAPESYEWAGFGAWEGDDVRIVSIDDDERGCLALRLETTAELEATARAHEATLCVPREAFPFHPNAVVAIWNTGSTLRIVRNLPQEDGSLWNTGELHVARGVDGWVQGPFDVRVTATDERCVGQRLACGGFRTPVAGGLQSPTGVRYVHPGETVEAATDDGRRAHLRLGQASSTLVTADGCSGAAPLGPSLEALVWYGEAPRR